MSGSLRWYNRRWPTPRSPIRHVLRWLTATSKDGTHYQQPPARDEMRQVVLQAFDQFARLLLKALHCDDLRDEHVIGLTERLSGHVRRPRKTPIRHRVKRRADDVPIARHQALKVLGQLRGAQFEPHEKRRGRTHPRSVVSWIPSRHVRAPPGLAREYARQEMARHTVGPRRADALRTYVRATRIIGGLSLLVLSGAIASDLANDGFWSRHALFTSLVASLIVVAVTAAALNEVLERRQRERWSVLAQYALLDFVRAARLVWTGLLELAGLAPDGELGDEALAAGSEAVRDTPPLAAAVDE